MNFSASGKCSSMQLLHKINMTSFKNCSLCAIAKLLCCFVSHRNVSNECNFVWGRHEENNFFRLLHPPSQVNIWSCGFESINCIWHPLKLLERWLWSSASSFWWGKCQSHHRITNYNFAFRYQHDGVWKYRKSLIQNCEQCELHL